MIDSAQKIHIGLNAVGSTTAESASSQSSRDSKSTLLDWFSGFFSGPVPSFAMLALLVAASPLVIKGLGSSPSIDSPQLVRLDSTVVRSSGGVGAYDLSAVNGQAAVVIRVKEVEYPDYQLVIKSADNDAEIWRSDVFQFVSGSRDQLVIIPEAATIANADIELVGISTQRTEAKIEFCNYTESCF